MPVCCGGAIAFCELCADGLGMFIAQRAPRHQHIGDLFAALAVVIVDRHQSQDGGNGVQALGHRAVTIRANAGQVDQCRVAVNWVTCWPDECGWFVNHNFGHGISLSQLLKRYIFITYYSTMATIVNRLWLPNLHQFCYVYNIVVSYIDHVCYAWRQIDM